MNSVWMKPLSVMLLRRMVAMRTRVLAEPSSGPTPLYVDTSPLAGLVLTTVRSVVAVFLPEPEPDGEQSSMGAGVPGEQLR